MQSRWNKWPPLILTSFKTVFESRIQLECSKPRSMSLFHMSSRDVVSLQWLAYERDKSNLANATTLYKIFGED